MKYLIEDTTLTGIANAIRNKTRDTDQMSPLQMINEINNIELGIPVNPQVHYSATGWVRPNNYPNLDVLFPSIGDTESKMYLTYDLTKTPGYGWISIYFAGATWYVERGHIENNSFVADWTSSAQSSGTYFRQNLDSANGDVQLWCIRSTGNITRFGFGTNTTTNANNYQNNVQPCVERCGRLPYVTNLGSSVSTTSTNICMATQWMEKDNLIAGKYSKVTNLANMYSGCYNLEEVACSSWDTSGWAVTAMGSMFYNCNRLKTLDLSGWDVSKWALTGTNFTSVWQNCYSLETLNISTWDVSKWTITSIASNWYFCFSLKELDLSGWNVSSWKLTTLATTWYYCGALRKLDVSTWDTTGWNVKTFSSVWCGCFSLEKLAIKNWVTTNWAVTTLGSTWSGCFSLRELDLSTWVTTSWDVTSLSNTWSNCRSLETLGISTWNTTNWAVTTLASTWMRCESLKTLNLSSWVTTNWAVTTCSQCWQYCYSLQSLGISTWNTSNWAVTNFAYVFQECWCLETINLNAWDVSNWAVTTVYYLFYNTYGAKTINLSSWDISNFALTESRYLYNSTGAETLLLPADLHGTVNNSKFTANVYMLVNFAPASLDIAQNYSNSTRLTKQSLLTIINRLPTVSTATTLTIGQTNKLKLTAEEIAVATQKGWTVA